MLQGRLVRLRPATTSDRRPIFEWLAHSDLTSLMLGLPNFPDNPAPTWDEFVNDYVDYFFDGSQPLLGRCFVIECENQAIGQVNYNEIDLDNQSTELDIWLADRQFINKGYGTDALNTFCDFLNKEFDIQKIYIAPSIRNERAVKAYQKAGFVQTTIIPKDFSPDYDDTIVMIKTYL